MVRISDKATATPAAGDLLLGTDVSAANATRNFTAASLALAVVGEFNVAQYGATGDGATDDTAAFQALAADLTSVPGGQGFGAAGTVPPGTYRLTDTTTFQNISGFIFGGVARGQVNFVWDGPSDRPMFKTINCREAVFLNARVTVAPGKTLLSAFDQYRTVPSGVWAPKNVSYRNILIDGTVGGASSRLLSGFRIGLSSGALDANNDFTRWDNVSVVNYKDHGWYLWGSQNYGNRMIQCRAAGGDSVATRGSYGVYVDTRAGFVWEGGDTVFNAAADFYAQSTGISSPIVIRDVISESSDRFLDVLQGQNGHILLDSARVAGDQVNADGEIIRVQAYHGHLTVRNSPFLERHATRRLRVRFATTVAARQPGLSFVWEDNTLIQNQTSRPGTAPTLDSGFFPALQPTRMPGNKVLDETAVVAIPWGRQTPGFVAGDTTPSVFSGDVFRVANSGPTTITNFDDGAREQTLKLLFLDSNTTIQHNANIRLAGGVDFVGTSNDTLRLVHNGTAWIEEGRSVNG